MTVFGWRCLIWLEESLISVLVFEIYNLQGKKYEVSFFCLLFGDRIINCSARSAIVICLSLSLAQSKTITPALSDQLSFPFDPNNFVSWFFCWCLQLFVCLFFGILCLLVDPVPPITRLSFTPTTYLDLVGAKSVFSRKIICNLLCIVFVIVFALVFVFLIILISLEPRAYYQQ